MRSSNLLQQIIWIVWSQTLPETYWIRVYTGQLIFFFLSIHSESKGSYLWILPSFCWTKRIISWFRRYQKHWTSNNSNKEGYILSTLYELNLTAMSCVLYLSPRFLGCTNNLQYAAGRYVRGNLVPALLSNNPWLWWLDNYASSICPSALRRRNGSSFLLLLSLTLIHCLLWGYHHLFHLSYQYIHSHQP